MSKNCVFPTFQAHAIFVAVFIERRVDKGFDKGGDEGASFLPALEPPPNQYPAILDQVFDHVRD